MWVSYSEQWIPTVAAFAMLVLILIVPCPDGFCFRVRALQSVFTRLLVFLYHLRRVQCALNAITGDYACSKHIF